jgi:hypothetical protein
MTNQFEKVYKFEPKFVSWYESWIDKKLLEMKNWNDYLEIKSLYADTLKSRYDFEPYSKIGLGRPCDAFEHVDMDEAIEKLLFRFECMKEKRIAWNLNFEEKNNQVSLLLSPGHTVPLRYTLEKLEKING